MRIGVVADTHSLDLPDQMIKDFKKVDLIIHAGDFCSVDDCDKLTKLKEVQAVHGNMDDSQVRDLYPRKQILTVEGCTIGLFHGEGAPKTLMSVVQDEFKGDDVDVVIFGHSHQPLNEKIGSVLYFNPGSPNDEVFAPYKSYGILEIENGKIDSKIVKVRS